VFILLRVPLAALMRKTQRGRAESSQKGTTCKSGKQIKTWKVNRESCEMNPSKPHCTDPNNPSKLAKASTLKDRLFKFYGICRNHRLSFMGMPGRDSMHLHSLEARPRLFSGCLLTYSILKQFGIMSCKITTGLC